MLIDYRIVFSKWKEGRDQETATYAKAEALQLRGPLPGT